MLVLGIESSCDETGLALYDTEQGLLAHTLHSQIDLHAEYGGVVPELASRDHVRRVVPLLRQVVAQAKCTLSMIDAIAYTRGPGLSGALLVGAAFAESLAVSLDKPILGIHHLEGHLLSPLLGTDPPLFPFVALLVSGGHTQLLSVEQVGRYQLLGETLDDAAGEAFDKTAKLLGLPYPGGAALSQLAESWQGETVFEFPRPMLKSGDLNFSFSGLKTAVLTQVRKEESRQKIDQYAEDALGLSKNFRAEIACAFQSAITDVLAKKSLDALNQTGINRLVVAGGVGANRQLRTVLNSAARENGFEVYYPNLEFCTDNGAMIALAGALRLKAGDMPRQAGSFSVLPRWSFSELSAL